MTQEEKQLLLKDLCARLDCGVICHSNKINLDGELLFINKVYNIVALYNDKAIGKFDTCQIADVKPYLRPMSSMTEEECKELGDLPATIENVGETLPHIPYYIEVARPEQLDWLNAHHFDYRGLIENGLALEAKEGMYKTE